VHPDDVQPKYYGSWQYNGKTLHFSDKFSGYSLFMSYMNAYPAKSLRFPPTWQHHRLMIVSTIVWIPQSFH